MNATRKRAWDILNARLTQITGFVGLDDLADSATLMCGLDDLEDVLKQGMEREAWALASAIAEEMLDEEGFPVE